MSQNSTRMNWSREEVDAKLDSIMVSIHETCARTAEEYGFPGNYMMGANIAGFLKVADAKKVVHDKDLISLFSKTISFLFCSSIKL